MPNIPTNHATEHGVEDLRRSYETAIRQLGQATRRLNPSQIPIAIRSRKAVSADPATEKRTVADAARALARLWNVSAALIR